jgi:transposase InsO family protein
MYYQWESEDRPSLKLIVPSSLKEIVLSAVHNTKAAGHFGIGKTTERAKKSYFWVGMAKDVKAFVNTCGTCAVSKKPNRTPRAPLISYQAGTRLERVHLDILGPFIQSRRGNKYVLMVVDQFSKWVACIPLPDQTAATMAQAFYEQFITIFGCPIYIHTDQGRNFDGNYFRALCELLQVVKTRTTPYRPSSNGQVERYNRIVLQFIRCFLQGKQQEWDEHLASVGMAIRSTENRSTGYTPNLLMFGEEINMPADILLGLPFVNRSAENPPEQVVRVAAKLQQAFREVRRNLQGTQLRQKKLYDQKAFHRVFQVGDAVYKLDSSTKVGHCKKLQPIFKGPYLVVQSRSPTLHRIESQNKSMIVHHDKLARCHDRVLPLWLRRRRHGLVPDAESIVEPPDGNNAGAVPAPGPTETGRPPRQEEVDEMGLDALFSTRSGRQVKRPAYYEA